MPERTGRSGRAGAARRTPYIRQEQGNECGLACLAMVACHHGLGIGLRALRRWCGLSPKGATLKALMETARTIGFDARPLGCEAGDLDLLGLPAILHWNGKHFVVLVKVEHEPSRAGRRFHIHDPARGPRAFAEAELSRRFTGAALELTRSGCSQAYAARPALTPPLGSSRRRPARPGFKQEEQPMAPPLLLTIHRRQGEGE